MQTKDSTREQRKRQLGIDCPDKVVWKNWEAGEEYVKKIVIKNVDVRAQAISYRLPERKATFLTPYPETTMLSSGMHMELDIRFCPTEVTEVHDCIEIKISGRGSFVVYLEALPPHAKLSVPEGHDFELCAVSKTYSEKVTVKNTGTVPLSFYWEAPLPFAIEPSRGELDKNESMEITLFFTPMDASASLCQAVCKMVDIEEVIATMKISGIGKYPFIRFQYHHRSEKDGVSKTGLLPVQKDHAPIVPLTCTTSTISFGDVVAGSVLVSEFYVENPTGVPAEVRVRRVDDNLTGPFKLTPSSVTIPGGGYQKFKVTYKAMSGGSLHINTFEIRSTAGNTIFLETRGAGVGPKVKCSTNSIDFGDVNLDAGPTEKQLTRVVQLLNMSNCTARYQFLNTAPGAGFAVEPCIGFIPPKEKVKVKIIFQPTHAMNYLRRLMILVHNSADALYIDVFGSAYDSFIRPLPFDLPQVESFYMRLERGLGRITPDELEALATSAPRNFPADTEEENNAQNIWRSIDDDMNSSQGKGLAKRNGRLSYHHIFVEHNVNAYPFKMDVTQVSFTGERAPAQTVSVSNYTKSMAMASWCIPEGSVYSVTPLQQDVPPNGRADFTVRFNSAFGGRSSPSAYDVGQYLECYVNFKQMRSFRLCCERSFSPPHCFTVQVNQDRGHASDPLKGPSGGSAGSLLSADKSIFFPAVRIGDTAYQVLSIENSGDVVMTYENVKMTLDEVSEKVADDITVFETTPAGRTTAMGGQDALNAMYKASEKAGGAARSGGPNDIIFTCYPPKGILHPGQHTLMLLKFSPTRYARYRAEAGFRVANMAINDKLSVTMRGESHIPKIKLEEFTQLTFRPTCISGRTNRTLSVLNPTCFPVSYQLMPSQELGGTVRLHPNNGYLERGERVWVTATFCPEEPRVHSGTLSLVAFDDSEIGRQLATRDNADEPPNLKEYATCVPIVGEGMHGIIEVEPTVIDCGDIASLEEQTVTITLYNSGMSEVQFEVRTMTRSVPKEWRHAAKLPRLRNHCGVLPARSHTLVLVTVYPSAGLSEYILYVMVGGVGTNLGVVTSPNTLEKAQLHPHCLLSIKGTHPAIQITDARSLSQRRSHLWCQLNINSINHQLSSDVIPSDVQNLGFAFPQNIHNLVPIAVDLGVGCRGSTPMNVSLLIQNTGDCGATFAFWLPMENDVSVEHWFQDDEELKDIQHVVDKAIIEINPSKGELAVGKSMVVTFTYRFDTVGVHKLPVLLRVNDSKKVLLILEGRTLPEGMEALAFHHPSAYDLLPVALGDVEPPIQSISIENPLEHEVSYQVHIDALKQVAEENFGFPILQCVNPSGVLAPHSVAQIAWYFRPLEAKEYNIEVPISTAGGEDYAVTFTGVGFHPKKTSIEVQREQLEQAFLTIPTIPQLNLVPSLPITLSVDALQLGAVPYFSLQRRMCYIENHHKHHIYSFHWDARHPTGDHVLSISPLSGLLRPGERIQCKITVYTGSTSQIIEWPITCHITNETLLEREAQQLGASTGVAEPPRGMGSTADNNADLLIGGPRPSSSEIIKEHGIAVARPPFQRTTCTKEYAAQRKRRKSVTNIPLESLGVRGLAARVKEQRRRELEFAAAIEDEASEDRAIIYNSLELLLQARIMPVEDYERIYGSRSLNAVHLPVMNVFKDPRADVSDAALGKVSKEDASLVRDIMDELLRSVVAHPRVKAAFTEPFIRNPVLYQDCAASQIPPRGKVIEGEGASSQEAAVEVAAPPPAASAGKLKGFMSNILEEALEQLICNVVSSVSDAQKNPAAELR